MTINHQAASASAAAQWKPTYSRWRHGGWYTNVRYPSGASGCVSNNFADKKWRIVCDSRQGNHTYETRYADAMAELEIALAEHIALEPWLAGITDASLKCSAVNLFELIDRHPTKGLDELVATTLRFRAVDAAALRHAGERYRLRTQEVAASPPAADEDVRAVVDDLLQRGRKYGFKQDRDSVREAAEESARLLCMALSESQIVQVCELALEQQSRGVEA